MRKSTYEKQIKFIDEIKNILEYGDIKRISELKVLDYNKLVNAFNKKTGKKNFKKVIEVSLLFFKKNQIHNKIVEKGEKKFNITTTI